MVVKIYKPAKNAMQSGKANLKKWLLEHEAEEDAQYIDTVMGWTGSSDTTRQIRLKFDTEKDAVAYAERNGLKYQLVEPNKPTTKIQAYSDTLM